MLILSCGASDVKDQDLKAHLQGRWIIDDPNGMYYQYNELEFRKNDTCVFGNKIDTIFWLKYEIVGDKLIFVHEKNNYKSKVEVLNSSRILIKGLLGDTVEYIYNKK